MTRTQREKLCEIMGYLWAKADEHRDDTLIAGYAEDIANLLAEDEKQSGGTEHGSNSKF